MEKLELKYILPYIQSGVESRDKTNSVYMGKLDMYTLDSFVNGSRLMVLYPVKNLTKVITDEGGWFKPAEWILNSPFNEGRINSSDIEDMCIQFDPTYYQKWLLDLLFEWKIDVFDLIGKNLAIDINTLK